MGVRWFVVRLCIYSMFKFWWDKMLKVGFLVVVVFFVV